MSVACSASFKFVQCIANFALCVSLEKSIFQKLLETAQTIGFIMLSVSVAYSARFGLVRCVAKFDHSGAQENWISQELWGTPQIISFSVRSS